MDFFISANLSCVIVAGGSDGSIGSFVEVLTGSRETKQLPSLPDAIMKKHLFGTVSMDFIENMKI